VGRYSDYHGEKGGMFISAVLLISQWIVRLSIIGPVLFVITETTRSFGVKSLNILQVELSYKHTNQSKVASEILTREVGVVFGAVLAALFVVVLTLLGITLKGTFIVPLVFSILPLIAARYLDYGN